MHSSASQVWQIACIRWQLDVQAIVQRKTRKIEESAAMPKGKH